MGAAVNKSPILTPLERTTHDQHDLRTSYVGPNWDEVCRAKEFPAGRHIDLSVPNTHPLATFTAENFGHQRSSHVGGVPGRIGGCNRARQLYAMRGERSGQLLTWRQRYVFVHDNRAQMGYLVVGQLKCEPLSSGFPLEETIWIKDHPDFQSVVWPLDETEFHDPRR
jgi:hypothetical protein